MNYPKFLYHPKHGAELVNDAEAEKKLGAGWVDSPAGFKKAEKIEEAAEVEAADEAIEDAEPKALKKVTKKTAK